MTRTTRTQIEQASAEARPALLDELAVAAAGPAETVGDAADDLAWAILHLGLARPAIRRYLLRSDDIESAEQRTLIAVALRIGSFRGEARFTTWLHQVASNEAKQLIREQSRHSSRADPSGPEEHAEAFVARVSSMIADEAAVAAALASLDERHRGPLLLRETDGLTYEEIAGRLEVPLGTAKTWVRRGRAELAAALADLYRPTRQPPTED